MTVRSMTAFARRDTTTEWGDLAWELRSVNHRYLEVSRKLPESFRALEPRVREVAGQRLGRGKVDCCLYFNPGASAAVINLDQELINQLLALGRGVTEKAREVDPLRVIDLLRWPGVIKPPAVDTDALQAAAMALLDGALDELVATRDREGGQIAQVIFRRLETMEQVVRDVRRILPEIEAGYRQRLRERLGELAEQLEPDRLEQEIVLFAQKADVQEELDRLDSHIAEVRRVLGQEVPIGRRLDFLMQELNREANTLGAKAADIRLTNASVELKVTIEQIREQVQNIE